MAQASSIQREPSMEEILASIRRIIEDNDTVSTETGQDTASVPPVENSNEIVNFRAELRPAGEASEDETDVHTPAPAASDTPNGTDSVENEWSAFESHRQIDDDVLMEPVEGGERTRTGFEALEKIAPDPTVSAATGTEEQTTAGKADPEASLRSELRPAILSDASGQQVAAAFRELNQVLEENRRKSIDQMAEEMLRPMLQHWLDNNLPRLVEKLVREEIERLARGT